MTRICSPRSTSPRRRELSSLAGEQTISINRTPLLTLRAVDVAERLGFDRNTALTLGREVAGLNPYAGARGSADRKRARALAPRGGRARGNTARLNGIRGSTQSHGVPRRSADGGARIALMPSFGSRHAKRVAVTAADLPCSRPYRLFRKVMRLSSVGVEPTRGAGPARVIGGMGLHDE